MFSVSENFVKNNQITPDILVHENWRKIFSERQNILKEAECTKDYLNLFRVFRKRNDLHGIELVSVLYFKYVLYIFIKFSPLQLDIDLRKLDLGARRIRDKWPSYYKEIIIMAKSIKDAQVKILLKQINQCKSSNIFQIQLFFFIMIFL